MLKAVRFDVDEHKELIEFIENYRDKKNRPNHSEAIRLLMQKGFESLNKQENPQPSIDVNAIKEDILNQVLQQIHASSGLQTTRTHPRTDVFTIVNEPKEELKQEVKKTPPPKPAAPPPRVDSNPLLANILGNSQR